MGKGDVDIRNLSHNALPVGIDHVSVDTEVVLPFAMH